MPKFSHINAKGEAHMVDVGGKEVSHRIAIATAKVRCQALTLELIQSDQMAKGDVFATARIAGIQAAKKCADLIPLCHPLMLTKISVDIQADTSNNCINIETCCKLDGKTGVEMEALTAASVTALTIYDMCKAVDKGMIIEEIKLQEKIGGKSGHWQAKTEDSADD